MGLLDRTPPPRGRSAAASRSGLTGPQLLDAANAAHAHAEQEFDRSPETREDLECAYLGAAHALEVEGHPDLAAAWLGVATVRRYQKGRRDDALSAFDAALTADPDRIAVWDAYLDYITYAVSAPALLVIMQRMPAPIRARKLGTVMAVAHGTEGWGTMSPDDQRRFRTELPDLLESLDDRPSLGALLSADALHEYRHGSHPEAHRLMRRAVATGHPTPACVDRLTIDLVKLGEKTKPPPSCATHSPGPSRRTAPATAWPSAWPAGATAAPTEPTDGDEPMIDTPTPAAAPRQLRPGENITIATGTWRAQVGWHDLSSTVDVDVLALLLGPDRRVQADHDMVFYNQLTSPDGSIRHGGEQTLGQADLFEELQVDLAAVPAHVATVAVCASVHGNTFAQVTGLHVRLEGGTALVFAVPPMSTERAVVLFELYRRDATWKVRAVGQGYDDGLAGLARDFGVTVT